ncbi:MAG: 2-oxoacid:acceptor oxidoreductase family protein, partial [Thermovirgaceae bacterium]|nr:2-oxoacid:acceptor oxidoreductase family protein [Thermovirgaceae bacterium]
FAEGKFAQAFPYLGGGGERRGAPVQAYARISDSPIKLREKIEEPDLVIVQDPSIMEMVDVLAGLKPGGILLINSEEPVKVSRDDIRTFFVPAEKIAIETLGRPIMNTALIGALSRITGLVGIETVEEAVRSKFPKEIAEKNILAVKKAFEQVGGAL